MLENLTDEGYECVQSDTRIIYKKVIHKGVWGSKAVENSIVQVQISDIESTGFKSKSLLESDDLSQLTKLSSSGSLTIGNCDSVVDKALEWCIQTMLVKETSKFNIKLPSLTNQQEECTTYPYIIECCIKLEEMIPDNPVYEWSDEKLYNVALHHKTEGVKLYNSGKKIEAFLRFSKSFKFLNIVRLNPKNDEDLNDFILLKIALLNNMANCQLEFENYIHVITLCSKVLSIDAKNVKSMYRRAMAYANIQKFDEAEEDLQKVLKIEPTNYNAKKKYYELKIKTKEKDANYAAVVKKMFSS